MFRRVLRVLMLCGAMFALAATSAQASAAMTVTIAVNTVSDTGSGAGECLASPEGSCTLRQAITAANGLSDTAVSIDIPAGTYPLTGGALDVDAASGSSITLTGASQADTIISAGATSQVIDFASGTIDASDLTFEDGMTSSADGGCIDIAEAATVNLDSTIVQGCSTSLDGGGLWVAGSLQMEDSTVEDDAAGDLGGGVAVETPAGDSASVELLTSMIGPDDTAADGGGIADSPSATAVQSLAGVTDVVVAGDTATETGGGIYASSAVNSDAGEQFFFGLNQATITGDAATGTSATGGGISAAGDIDYGILSSTIAGNQATASGGDIAGSSPNAVLQAVNTIIADGSAGNGEGDCAAVDPVTSPASEGDNLDDQNNCGLDAPGDQINTPADLGPLQDNGGDVNDGTGTLPTMALDVNSPAIGAGAPAGSTVPCLANDARGTLRPTNASGQVTSCDIGAYQSAPPTFSALSAESITTSAATISADAANPDWVNVTLSVEYGTSSGSYPDSSPASEDISEPGSAQQVANGGSAGSAAVSFALSGLAPDTTYYYRIVGTNSRGAVTSSEASFTTSPPVSVVPPAPATGPPIAPSNRFSESALKVSAAGALSGLLTAPDPGVFALKATFKVKESVLVKKGHKKVRETKTVTETYATGTVRVATAVTERFSLKISAAAARELKQLKQVKVTLSIAFTPTGGTTATKQPTLTVKRSTKGRYS